MLIGATIAGREKVEVSRAIQGEKGILLTETNHACPESWSRSGATSFAQVESPPKERLSRYIIKQKLSKSSFRGEMIHILTK